MAAGDPRRSWQREDCPGWCVVDHAEADHPDDRKHMSRQIAAPVLAMAEQADPTLPGRDSWYPDEVVVCLQRRDGGGQTGVYIGDGAEQRIEIDVAGVHRIVHSLRALLPDVTW